MRLMLIVAAATHEREAFRYLEFGRFSAADVVKALVTGLMKKHVLKSARICFTGGFLTEQNWAGKTFIHERKRRRNIKEFVMNVLLHQLKH